ncbi:hypothetical protein [Acinetobacter modestus]|uniref:hypothetical protein n=1 Tax=Acinetobacter modestus TaxID=1776740 RepID=UPI0030178CE2
MHTLLTVQEAFAARQAGKSIVCRHVESEIFEKLNNVSADTWFDPHYVFAIEIETITLGGLEFTRPYTLTELSSGDKIYFCGASGKILKGNFNPDNEMLVAGVKNGSVQRDEENAIAQVTAFRSLLNIEVEAPVIIDYDFFAVDEEPKKTVLRGRRKKDAETKSVDVEPQVPESEPLDESDPNVKKIIDAISSAANLIDLDIIENELDESPIRRFVDDELNQFKGLIKQKRVILEKGIADAEVTNITERVKKATTIAELNDLELEIKNQRLVTPQVQDNCDQLLVDIAAKREELNQLDLIESDTTDINDPKGVVNTFRQQINDAKNDSDLQKIDTEIKKFWSISNEDRNYLEHLLDCKRNELSTAPNSISAYQKLVKDAENSIHYPEKLSELTTQVQQAQSIDEANEAVSQTLDWTTEQRLPLITAISKRLVELGKPLIAQIREATELNTLEAYLVQIQELIAIDGTLAHQCMQAYTVRKSALTQTSPA